ncbi:MAG: hypothetical protein U0903_00580 [Planctomycetales bacterium]
MGDRAFGSSYVVKQFPKGERVGGVTVTISPRSSGGKIEVLLTKYHTGELHSQPEDLASSAEAAVEGIRQWAADANVNLDQWDILIDRFFFHDVDSFDKIFHTAAYSAVQGAFATWNTRK